MAIGSANSDCPDRVTQATCKESYTLENIAKADYLGREVGDVRLFAFESRLGDEHGEVAVFDAQLLDLPVEERLNGLPDRVGPGAQYVATRHVVVLDHFTFRNHLNNRVIGG